VKVLVTGSDEYIGVWLAPLLLQRGHDVVGLDRGFYRDGWLYDHGIGKFPRARARIYGISPRTMCEALMQWCI
jgi:nucleoside-diphosphate-sugar epimerase